jgi:hypothetical protein
MAELNEADLVAEPEARPDRAGPHRWTPETAREAARLSRERRSERRHREPPTDADIERGLRERAVSDPRAAEILLRWLQRPRPVDTSDDIEALSTEELERLHACLMSLSSMDPTEVAAYVRGAIAGTIRPS